MLLRLQVVSLRVCNTLECPHPSRTLCMSAVCHSSHPLQSSKKTLHRYSAHNVTIKSSSLSQNTILSRRRKVPRNYMASIVSLSVKQFEIHKFSSLHARTSACPSNKTHEIYPPKYQKLQLVCLQPSNSMHSDVWHRWLQSMTLVIVACQQLFANDMQ